MPVRLEDAIEIAWYTLLVETGEPPVPDWRADGFIAGALKGNGWAGYSEQWWISFIDPNAGPGLPSSVGLEWVDRQTGDTRVWVNEDYEPAFWTEFLRAHALRT